MDSLLQMKWGAPNSGYQWVKGAPVENQGLDEEERKGIFAEGYFLVWRESRPAIDADAFEQAFAKHKNLFQVFAATPPTRLGILRFANKYGSLGGRANSATVRIEKVVSPNPRFSVDTDWGWLRAEPDNPNRRPLGEPLRAWEEQINLMRLGVRIWGLLNKRDEKGLAEFLSWSDNVVWLNAGGYRKPQWYSPEKLDDPTGKLRRGDVVRPARAFLSNIINENLEKQGGVLPRLVYDEEHDTSSLRFGPTSLIGALWLQFAQAIDRKRSYKQCEMCGKWFDISEKLGARADKKTCDAACRMRLSRKLKRDKRVADAKITPSI